MKNYSVIESSSFSSDLEEAALWILESNKEQSEEFANKCVLKLQHDIFDLIQRLQSHPDSGELIPNTTLRKTPIYSGRYSAQWIVVDSLKQVILLNLQDLKYPKQLRNFSTDI
ncbi:hypothetical protein K2X05_03790 [bacterium]|nr:hypothetical protein [bacterium]